MYQLPKTCRVVIVADAAGRLNAYPARESQTTGQRMARQGFRPIMQMRAPLRRLRQGWAGLTWQTYPALVRLYRL